MTFSPKFNRKACGKFSELDNNLSVRFGSSAYVLEDDLNEIQSIAANKTANFVRSKYTSGIINIISTNNGGTISIPGGTYINVDGHIFKIPSNIIMESKRYLLVTFINTDMYEDRVGCSASERIKALFRPSDKGGKEIVNDNHCCKTEAPNKYSPTGYIYYLEVIDEKGNPIYSEIKNNIVGEINDKRYINQPTIKFGRPVFNGSTSTKIGWHGRININLSDNDIDGNWGILADYLWNPNIKDYVGIGMQPGEIVTWGPDGIIEGAIADYCSKLRPGFTLKSDDLSDVNLGSTAAMGTQKFNGNGQYLLNLTMNVQNALTPTPKDKFTEKPDENKFEFYNKFTVNEKGIITSATQAKTLADLGISDFAGDAEDLDLLRYSKPLKQWQAVRNKVSNVDQNFKYDSVAPTKTERLNYNGYFYATRVYNAVYNDYAEYFEKGEDNLEPGDLIEINDDGKYIKTTKKLSKKVVGVYSDTYGHLLGGTGSDNDEKKFIPIGLCGRVNVKVTGDIKPGDLLVSSDIPGVAESRCINDIPGTIIGKALQYHSGNDINRIQMLIMNR